MSGETSEPADKAEADVALAGFDQAMLDEFAAAAADLSDTSADADGTGLAQTPAIKLEARPDEGCRRCAQTSPCSSRSTAQTGLNQISSSALERHPQSISVCVDRPKRDRQCVDSEMPLREKKRENVPEPAAASAATGDDLARGVTQAVNSARSEVSETADASEAGWIDRGAAGSRHTRRPRRCFSSDEVGFLKAGVAKFGAGQWKKILAAYKFADHRTTIDLKDKHRNLSKAGLL